MYSKSDSTGVTSTVDSYMRGFKFRQLAIACSQITRLARHGSFDEATVVAIGNNVCILVRSHRLDYASVTLTILDYDSPLVSGKIR